MRWGQISPVALLVALQLLFLAPLFHTGLYHGHDSEVQVARIAAYATAFADGHFPPRWAGNLNYGYGAPVFIFFYPLPGYLAALVHMVFLLSFQDSFKFIIGAAFILAPLGMYFFTKQIVAPLAAFMAAIVYGLAPYHFLDLYVRADVGELLALAIIPWIFWAIELVRKRPTTKIISQTGVLYSFLILSHHGIALFLTPVIAGYMLFWSSGKKCLVNLIESIFIGLGISGYFWLPALVESRFTMSAVLGSSELAKHFVSLPQIIYTPWGFADKVNIVGGMSPQLGIIPTMLVIIAIILLVRKNLHSLGWYWLGVFGFGVYLVLPASEFIWKHIPLIASAQFPWRLMSIVHLATAVLAAYVCNNKLTRFIGTILSLTMVVVGFSYARVAGFIDLPDSYYYSYAGNTSFHNETTSIWSAGDPSAYPKYPAQVIAGQATITSIGRNSIKHTYSVIGKTASRIVDSTLYFPGWEALIDGQKVPIEFQDPNYRGLITLGVPAGTHVATVRFGESRIRFIANIISIATLIIIAGILTKRKYE